MDAQDAGDLPAVPPEEVPIAAPTSSEGLGKDFDRFYSRVWELAFAVASKRARTREACDVAQEVALDFYGKWKAGKIRDTSDSHIEGWTVSATRFEILARSRAQLRREAREFVYDFTDHDSIAVADARSHDWSPGDFHEASELAEVARRTVSAMPSRVREVYQCKNEHDQDFKTIAADKHIAEVTVRRHYYMAIELLEKAVHRFLADGLLPETT